MKTNLLGENLAKIKGMRVLKGNLLGNKVRNKFLRLQDGKGAGRSLLGLANKGADAAEDYGNRGEGKAKSTLKKLKERVLSRGSDLVLE